MPADQPLYTNIDPDLLVYLPTGTPFPTMNEDERDYLQSQTQGYLEMRFEHASDLAELDRLLQMELLSHRWRMWLALNETYDGAKIDPKLSEKADKLSIEIRQVKSKLGIDKMTRDRTRGEGSLWQRISLLLTRARRFELYRCRQTERALELTNELISLVQLHQNTKAHPEEMREMRVTPEDLIQWIWEVYKPEFEEIAEHFADHEQRIWHLEDVRLESLRS